VSGSDTDALLTILLLGIVPVVFLIYAIPSIIAFRRRHPNRFAILVINIAFGGTGIGWLGALVWALSAVHLSGEVGGSHGGESGLNIFANNVKPVRLAGSRTAAVDGRGAIAPLTTLEAVRDIERLSALRIAGHLSENEFAHTKRDVLRRTSTDMTS
jgi:hypothetical protein